MQTMTILLLFWKGKLQENSLLFSCLLLVVFFLLNSSTGEVVTKSSRYIKIVNDSGSPIELYVIVDDGEAVPLILSRPDNDDSKVIELSSFVGDVMEIREESGACEHDQSCRIATFTVKDDNVDEQIYHIRSNFELDYYIDDNNDEEEYSIEDEDDILESDEQDYSSYDNLTYVTVPSLRIEEKLRPPGPRSLCDEQVKSLPPFTATDTAIQSWMEYTSCIEANLTHELYSMEKQLISDYEFIESMSDALEEYTCSDEHLPTSRSIRNETWTNNHDQHYHIGILHDRPRSKIHILTDFISEEECDAIEKEANPILQIAEVADGRGGSEVSEERKAMQGSIPSSNPIIAPLSQRVYDYVNHVSGLDIRPNGQEEILSIQYTGRGNETTPPDRYLPHCDGDCDGMPFRLGERFATMIMYCTIPIRGGATNFKNAAIHIQPTKGAAAFFSYIGFDDFINDNGFSTHSGCPVLEGEKKIVTQWIRYGVDDEHPWDSFNSLGMQIDEEEE